mgnify:CR=1 FL=1
MKKVCCVWYGYIISLNLLKFNRINIPNTNFLPSIFVQDLQKGMFCSFLGHNFNFLFTLYALSNISFRILFITGGFAFPFESFIA